MHKITIGERNYMSPSTWEELTDAQLLAVAQLVYASQLTPAVKWQVFRHLVPAPMSLLKKLTEGQIYDLLQTIEWLWTLPMSTCPVEHFVHEGKTYHLPAPDLQHVTLGEYAVADSFLRKFLSAGDTQALDGLVATLCRPAGHNSLADVREAYNQGTANARQKAFRSLPLGLRIVVLQYWVGRQRHVVESFKILFQEPQSGKSSNTSQPTGQSGLGWFAIIFDLATGGAFGDFEKVSATPIHTVLMYLVHQHYELKKLEKTHS